MTETKLMRLLNMVKKHNKGVEMDGFAAECMAELE